MRTTVDIPDDLFRKVKAKAVMEGVTLKDYIVHSLQRELTMADSLAKEPSSAQARAAKESWLQEFNKLSDDLSHAVAGLPGPSTLEQLRADRGRLDPKPK